MVRAEGTVIGLTLALVGAAPVMAKPSALPIWLAGCWSAHEDESRTEECWEAPRDGIMTGTSVITRGEMVELSEAMRLARDAKTGALTFAAASDGGAWTTFIQEAGGKPGLAFVNRANDYPQRIRYWREGDRLLAEIALADGSEARRWTFRRAR